MEEPNLPMLPKRQYGKTDVELSVIGFGGIVVMSMEQGRANRVVAEAVERGINYFDVAPTYGNAQERLGPALEPYRKDCFLACKTTERTRERAEADLRGSMEHLRTDHFDLYQLHGLTDMAKDVDVAFGKGGAIEALLEAKRVGKVRFLGFSAHTTEAALAAMDRFDFDSVLFPINFACYHRSGFGRQVVERAREKGMAVLALKALARQKWPEGDPQRAKYGKCWYQPLMDPVEADLGLRFALSLPITAATTPGEEELFRLAADIASRYRPLTPEEEAELMALAARMEPIFSES